MIAIIDYGAGNIQSVYKALKFIGADCKVTSDKDEILNISNLNVLVITQRLESLNRYNNLKETNKDIIGPKTMVAIGKYNYKTKYNKKNITRYLGEKKELNIIPFNTLYFEAAEEASVADLFLRLRKIKDTTDKNYIFVNEVSNLTNNIIVRLQELQKRMRWENVNI